MENNPVIGVLGGLGTAILESGKIRPSWFDQFSHSYAVGPQADNDGKIQHIPAEVYGAASFWQKKALDKIKESGVVMLLTGRSGNKLISGDDVEMCYLVQLLGYEVWYDQRLKFQHFISNKRLDWDYYQQMKMAISRGSIFLFPYEILLKYNSKSQVYFIYLWLRRLTGMIIYNCRCFFSICFSGDRSSRYYLKFRLKIMRVKIQNYFFKFHIAYNRFLQLQMIKRDNSPGITL
jgi:hypothetical protein